jgi:TFIIF-interacting CTD phosphatase-like protein
MYVTIRPYAEQILKYLAKDFELIVFTSACPEYAEIIVELLETE